MVAILVGQAVIVERDELGDDRQRAEQIARLERFNGTAPAPAPPPRRPSRPKPPQQPLGTPMRGGLDETIHSTLVRHADLPCSSAVRNTLRSGSARVVVALPCTP